MHRSRLYSITVIACLTGYAWLAYNQYVHTYSGHTDNVCLMKNLTGLPCPSCGASRSVISILDGQFMEAVHLNPIGYLLLPIMLISPFWILLDVITSADSFLRVYQKAEHLIRNKW